MSDSRFTLSRFAPDYRTQFNCTPTRCCLNLSSLELDLSESEADAILIPLGYKPIRSTVIEALRPLIGVAQHQRGAIPSQAPQIIDCSLLAWWAYSQVGVQLPRYSINQRASAVEVPLSELVSGDLLFRSGWRSYYQTDAVDGVGHVGVASGKGTVIHAPSKQAGVIEESVEAFVGDGTRFRGAGRIFPAGSHVITYEITAEYQLSSSLDLRCLIFQQLEKA